MDIQQALDFTRENHRAVLGTYRSDGRVQLTPILVGVDEDGRLVISTTEQTAKVRNLRRDPRAALCVIADRFFGTSVQVEGRAWILSLPDAMEALVAYYRGIAGEHPDWDEYRQAMERERRCLIVLDVERAV